MKKKKKKEYDIYIILFLYRRFFLFEKARFVASNGFVLTSLSCPAIGAGYNSGSNITPPMMYLRGSAHDADDRILHTKSVGYIEKLKAAVIEYNIVRERIS